MIDWDFKLVILSSLVFLAGAYLISGWQRKKGALIIFLIALFSFSGFNYNLNISDSVIPTNFAEIVYFLLLMVMGLAWLSNRQNVPTIGLEWPIRIYLAAALMGVLTAFYFNLSIINIIIEVKSYVVYIFYLYLVPFLLNEKKDVRKYLWVLVLFSIIPILYVLPNLKDMAAIEAATESERGEITKYWGPLNVLVGFISPVIFIAMGLHLATRRTILKGSLLILVILCLFIVFYSQTRSAWVSVSTSSLLFLFLSKKKMYLGVALIVLVTFVFLTGSMERVKSIFEHRIVGQTIESQDSSLQVRLERWEVAKKTFEAHPLTGTGWGGYLTSQSENEENSVSSGHPVWHNSFFEILSQLGLLGLAAFYWLWFRIFKIGLGAWENAKDQKDKVVLSGLISAVVCMFVYSLGEQQFYRVETASVSWFITGLLIHYANTVKRESEIRKVGSGLVSNV
jgi:O-antigen ligase